MTSRDANGGRKSVGPNCDVAQIFVGEPATLEYRCSKAIIERTARGITADGAHQLRFLPEGMDCTDVAGEDIGVEGAPFIEHRVQGRLPDVGRLVWEHRDNVSGRLCGIEGNLFPAGLSQFR